MEDFFKWVDNILYVHIFNVISDAFPDMGFKLTGGGKRWVSTKHLNGKPSKDGREQLNIWEGAKYCVKDWSGEAKSLLIWEQERGGGTLREAAKRLCDKTGLIMPTFSYSKEWEEYAKKEEQRTTLENIFASALFSDKEGAAEVREYLIKQRKWEQGDIIRARLGYIDAEIIAQLPPEEQAQFRKDRRWGSSHRLVIPLRSGTRIVGFKVRTIEPDFNGADKYLNLTGSTLSTGFLGIQGGQRDAVIVEGDLDALHARVKGAINVVSTMGGGVSSSQVEDAIRKGVTRFTLLFDNDTAGEGYIEPSAIRILERGVSVHVAKLPEGHKDLDSYLGEYDIESFNELIKGSHPFSLWKLKKVIVAYLEKGDITAKTYEDLVEEVAKIINSPYTKPFERVLLYEMIDSYSEVIEWTSRDIKEQIEKIYLKQQKEIQEGAIRSGVSAANTLMEKGDLEGALKLLRNVTEKNTAKEQSLKFSNMFTPKKAQDYEEALRSIKKGLPTGFKFEIKRGGICEELSLNPGLTFICGYRGHGKTAFLNTMALNEAKRNIELNNGKKVLYFSYEIDAKKLMADMLTNFIEDAEISNNPVNTILGYFRGEGWKYAESKWRSNPENISKFERKKRQFFNDYLASGALTIVGDNLKVEELLRAIKFYLTYNEVSLICIDYAQLLYSEEWSRARTEEIKKIVNDIKDFANAEGLPFLMAAQFNREIRSPLDVDTKNIGEAGDLERIADTCIGLFNLKELKPLGGKEDIEVIKLLNNLDISQLTELKPIKNKLFARLMKRRDGFAPIDIILDWKGKIKRVIPNDPEKLEVYTQDDFPEL